LKCATILNNLFSIFEKNEMGGASGAYGGGERVHRLLVGKLEGKRPLGKSRRRWKDTIKMIFRSGVWGLDRVCSG
jgi:hypothetical protein